MRCNISNEISFLGAEDNIYLVGYYTCSAFQTNINCLSRIDRTLRNLQIRDFIVNSSLSHLLYIYKFFVVQICKKKIVL